jgi:hypothetical protein
MKSPFLWSLLLLGAVQGTAAADREPRTLQFTCTRGDYVLDVHVAIGDTNRPVSGYAVLSASGAALATMRSCELLSYAEGGDVPTVGRCTDEFGNWAQLSVGGIGGLVQGSAGYDGQTVEFNPADCAR